MSFFNAREWFSCSQFNRYLLNKYFVSGIELSATGYAKVHELWSLPSKNIYSPAGETDLLDHDAGWRIWCLRCCVLDIHPRALFLNFPGAWVVHLLFLLRKRNWRLNATLLMFCPFLMSWCKEYFFMCCRALMNLWSHDLPFPSAICAILHNDPFITVMVLSSVSRSLNHFCFSPLGTKLQAFSGLQMFI